MDFQVVKMLQSWLAYRLLREKFTCFPKEIDFEQIIRPISRNNKINTAYDNYYK